MTPNREKVGCEPGESPRRTGRKSLEAAVIRPTWPRLDSPDSPGSVWTGSRWPLSSCDCWPGVGKLSAASRGLAPLVVPASSQSTPRP
jgi:hypothetical protein